MLTLEQVADALQVEVRTVRTLLTPQRDENAAAAAAGRAPRGGITGRVPLGSRHTDHGTDAHRLFARLPAQVIARCQSDLTTYLSVSYDARDGGKV